MSSTNGAIPKSSGSPVTSSPSRTRISEESQFSDISVMNSDGSGAPPPRNRGRPKSTLETGLSISTPRQHHMRSRLTLPSIPAAQELQATVDHHRTLSEFFSRLNVSQSELDHSTSTDGEDQHVRRRQRVAGNGQDYVHVKPKYSGRLYDALLKVDPDVDEEVNRWLSLYQENADEAILVLIRFMVDICGYQAVDIETVFSSEEKNFKELKNFLEENTPELQEHGLYLFRGRTSWGKRMQEVVLVFCKRLFLITFESDTLFDCDILLNFAGVVTMLITSTKRAMHHTGIVIGAKTVTTFMEIILKIENEIEKYNARPKTEQLERKVEALKSSEQQLLTIIEKFHQMVEKRCCIRDAYLSRMKTAVLEEMFKWFTLDPSLITNTKYVTRLLTLLVDDVKFVRLTALQVCKSLINSDELFQVLTPYIDKFVLAIIECVIDTDFNIATLAVELLNDIINKDGEVIPEGPYCNKILTLVYCKDDKVAVAAGKLLIDLLSKCYNDGGTAVGLLKRLINFSLVQTVVDYVALLVEAIFPHCPVLQDWNTITNLILSNELERNHAVRLLDILSCAAYQVLTGSPKISRQKIITCKFIKAHEIRRTSHVLLNAVPGLLEKFAYDAQCTQNIIEIFLNIDYKDASIWKFKHIVINVVNKLQEIFNKTTHSLLLEPISNAFHEMRAWEFPFSDKIISFVDDLKLNIIRDLSHCLESAQQVSECDDTHLSRIEGNTARLAALLTSFDMTELMDVVAFDRFLKDIGFLKAYNVNNILKIYYWYIIWTFRRVLEAVLNNDMENFTEKVDFVKKTTDRFLKFCYEFMENLCEPLVANNAFGYATKIYLIFHQEMEKSPKSNEQLKELMPKIDDQRCKILSDLADNLFFYERGLPKKERCKLLQNVIFLASVRLIPFQELNCVYKYYHECFEEYGMIFDEGLNKLRENSSVCLVGVILQTLNHCYTTFNLEQKEEKDSLRMLTKRFEVFISKSVEERMLILKLGIKYAVFSEARLPILYFLKYFSNRLSAKDKQEIVDFLKSKLPEAQVKHPQVVDFIRCLKSSMRSARLKPVTRSLTKSSEPSINDATTTLRSTVPDSDRYTIEDEPVTKNA